MSSVEDSTLALIVTFKTVQTKVNEIKTKFALDEGTDWRASVGEVGKKKKKKIEKEANTKRYKERKEKQKKMKEIESKRGEWLVENTDTTVEAVNITHRKVCESEKPEKIDKRTNICKDLDKRHTNSVDSTECEDEPPTMKNKLQRGPVKTVDPFFITGSGENYLATTVIDRIQPNGPNDGLDRKERRAQQFGKPTKTKRNDEQFGKSLKMSSKLNRTDDNSTTSVVDLHPSWAAKMKTKGIGTFQGKKIKFGDEESPIVSKTSFVEAKLHPSWVAKQKLKPVISEFKGNKIVFDD